jgi:hypothetical protein
MMRPSTQRRLRCLAAHLSVSEACSAGPPAADPSQQPQPGPENGIGPVKATPPLLALSEPEAIVQFYEENGFVLITEALSGEEVAYLNEFCDATRAAEPELWGIDGPMPVDSYAQPLLDFAELERFAMHPSTFPLIRDRFCGGADRCKFCQFDFRHTPRGAGRLANRIHRDLPDR